LPAEEQKNVDANALIAAEEFKKREAALKENEEF
jgi:hypothetical protein